MSPTGQFVHLHVHSHYSKLDGLSAPKDLIKKAIADGMPALALTDHGNMFGIKEFSNAINSHNKDVKKEIGKAQEALDKAKAGGDESAIAEAEAALTTAKGKFLKPILGCEMYVARGDMHTHEDREDNGDHLIVLAKNEKGYHNLIKLVSLAWTEGYYYHPRIDKKHLEERHEGLIVCSACLGGEIPQYLLRGNYEAAEKAAAWWKSVFGDDYYLELQRHKASGPNANHETYERQIEIEPHMIAIARKLGIKLVATNDAHFVNQSDAEAHELLIRLSTNRTISQELKLAYTKQEWLKTRAEMWDVFADLPEALETTLEIANKVEIYSLDHAPIMPNFPIPAEFGSEEEYRQRLTEDDLFREFTCDEHGNTILSEEDARDKIKKLGGYDKLYRIKFEADYLEKLAFDGAKEFYPTPLPPEVEERIRFELHVMKTMGFPGYFLIVQDFIQKGREMGVSIGPGRGSAAGSVVAYCLGITQIDPLKYDLLFERFLNPDRISLPDIDVDFDDDGREVVLNYVTDLYGAPNVAHIITYGTMAAKSAIKDVARILEYPLDKSNALTKLVPRHMPMDPKKPEKELKPTVANLIDHVDDFKKAMQDPKISSIMNYARELDGTVRNTGVHACGVIICRDDVSDWVPVSTAVDKNGDKILVTEYEGSVIEETGLIKMDFLGLKTLSIIREAVANIKAHRGIDIDMRKIPIDDKKTYELYSRGATVGTFQFESAGMQRYLRELQPTVFEDLIAMNALYRPGPMENIPEFIERKQGRHEIKYDIPEMEKYLKDTYGITVYQEQVMLLSRLLGGLTRGQSDTLRKAMGKKLIEKMNSLKDIFMKGGVERGHKREILEKIWKEWEKFASYAFNKSHATCYSWVAFQTGYLKANYPAEYMAAVLSRNINDITSMTTYMDECKSMGISVKGPDINESSLSFSVTKAGDIRFGLCAIKGIGGDVVRRIIEARDEGGLFRDIYDFVERVPSSSLNRRVFESLDLAGAFDCFEGHKREDYVAEAGKRGETMSELLLKYGAQYQADKNSQETSLFGFDDSIVNSSRPPVPSAIEWTKLKRLDKERELVGMYLSAHPLDSYRVEVEHAVDYTIAERNEMGSTPSHSFTIGGMIMEINERTLPSGTLMTIVKIEDFTGSCDFTIFEKQRNEYASFLSVGSPVLVTGRFSPDRKGGIRYNVEQLRDLTALHGKLFTGLTIKLNTPQIAILESILEKFQKDETSPIDLNFIVTDPELGRPLRFQSALRLTPTQALLKALDQEEIAYSFDRIKAAV